MQDGALASSGRTRTGIAALTLGALGVVFGDIGTSPLYAFQSVFFVDGGVVHPTAAHVYGAVSLVFWTITLIVSVKYVTFVMRADNDGEGGIMALVALVQRTLGPTHHATAKLVAVGGVGAALFYGDSAITPALSVLSANEGLKVVDPGLDLVVVPLTVGVLTALFVVERWGTERISRLFGPVMLVWFAAIALAGLREVAQRPAILKGLSPTYATSFLAHQPFIALVAIGAVVLCVTGAEALYADMGHFGRVPIRLAWFALVFPALSLNYLGQGGLILAHPHAKSNPFYLLLPVVVARADGRARRGRHGDRFAGGHLGGVLADEPGDPPRLPPAGDHPAHLERGGRPDLHPAGELGAVRRRRDDHACLPHLHAPLGCVRRGRHRHLHHHHDPVPRRWHGRSGTGHAGSSPCSESSSSGSRRPSSSPTFRRCPTAGG